MKGASALPPYHPDYEPGDAQETSSDEEINQPRIRRGSEGYEVRPVDRDEMLRRYLEEIGEVPGRYHRYIPQPEEGESQDEDDDMPLATVSQTKLAIH